MSFQESIAVWIGREPTLDEELATLGEEDVFDLANLSETQTGVPGVITITTIMGSHGPRVKYFVKTGKGQPSFSVAIAATPRVVANSLEDRTLSRMAPVVIDWVALNHDALNAFWWEGGHWMQTDVQAFIDTLKKV